MAQTYIEYKFSVLPLQPGSEILIAQLGELGFESFVETDEGVDAYILKDKWEPEKLEGVQLLNNEEFIIGYTSRIIEQVNWNEEWERNFEPIEVSEQCVVRAPFHSTFHVSYEIIIEPKMSFGTGHHETTHMMLEYLLEADMQGKTVLDMGCGTAVLAILAEMRGAGDVDAIDIDAWCVENSGENISRNNCRNIKVALGDSTVIDSVKKYDVVIANINRNVLLKDIGIYADILKEDGMLLLSGFYLEDLEIIRKSCVTHGLKYVNNKLRNNWVAVKFVN
ncbi:50S ribosomal protein L11 methyltransferase [Pukyongia salina]|uniref:Ribosomal protein L11 methyltransferase n=1 Tax=Pukyongia salina TaxID=2094025 RepID=A0A2S0HXF5_9FLAO|nr:50S ribosomal protein L11 methyltransferase [Pukyongia salina]AVI51342.1 50S ribosomal protein L11 methyltransferase [Pukyongia salina]